MASEVNKVKHSLLEAPGAGLTGAAAVSPEEPSA